MLSWLLNTFRHYFTGEEEKDHLSVLPPHIKDDIIGNLDLRSRLMLRKSCETYQFFVDNGKLHIDQLSIRYALKYIELTTDDGFCVRYQDVGGEVVVRNNEKIRLLQGDNFIELFKKDLLILLTNKKLTIGTLSIKHFRLNFVWSEKLVNRITEMDQNVLEVFKNLQNQLNIEHLIMKTVKPEALRFIFFYLNPASFRSLELTRIKWRERQYPHDEIRSFRFDDKEIFMSEQWKHLDNVYLEQPMSVDDLMWLAHFKHVNVKLFGRINVGQFRNIRDKLLENTQLEHFKIRGLFSDWEVEDINNIRTSLGLPNNDDDDEPTDWVRFPYPTDPDKYLMALIAGEYIMFCGPCCKQEFPNDEEEPFCSSDEEEQDSGVEEEWEPRMEQNNELEIMLSWLLETFKNYFPMGIDEKKDDDLSRLPTPLNDGKVGKLDIFSRLKASGPFREFANRKDIAINELSIKYDISSIEVTVDGEYDVRYEDICGGTVVKCDNQVRLLKGDNFVELFKRDLLTILSNKSLTINTLKIVNTRRTITRGRVLRSLVTDVDEQVMNVFKDLKQKLRVENLVLRVMKPSQIKKLVVHLDDCIRTVKFPRVKAHQSFFRITIDYPFKWTEYFKNDQLNNLYSFYSDQTVEAASLVNLTKFPLVNVKLSSDFHLEQFKEIRKHLYANPNLIQMKIRASPHGSQFESVLKFLWISGIQQKPPPRIWRHFKNPIHSGHRLSVDVTVKTIIFRGPKFVESLSTEDEEKAYDSEDDYELDYYQ